MTIDAHVHLDDKGFRSAAGAADEVARQMLDAKIDHAIVLHLDKQPWSLEDVAAAMERHDGMHAFANVHPGDPRATEILTNAVNELKFIGLKLHPRLQEFRVDSPAAVKLVECAGNLNIPVLIDAFPDGTGIMQGFDVLSYARLAQMCPGTRIIWAHMGGHRVLDMLMLAKRLPNVYMDMSYSLLYYRGSSVPKDMVYAMRSMKFRRIFYGSDYPDRPLGDSLSLTLGLLRALGLDELEIRVLMHSNAEEFFSEVIK